MTQQLTLSSAKLRAQLTPHGDIAGFSAGDLQISQYVPSSQDPGMAGLWLRERQGNEISRVVALHGIRSHAVMRQLNEHCVEFVGEEPDISWNLVLDLTDRGWNYCVHAHSSSENEWDLVTAQDLALAPQAQALTSEPYISQYIAYHAKEKMPSGIVVAARQAMANAPVLPLYVTSIFPRTAAFLTDGFDFYGKNARQGKQAQALTSLNWDNSGINQYEMGMICLLSEPQQGDMHWDNVVSFNDDYRGDLDDACEALSLVSHETIVDEHEVEGTSCEADVLPFFNGRMLSNDELLELTGDAAQDVERDDEGRVLSYFTCSAAHVVSGYKDLIVDRSHGHILLAGIMDTQKNQLRVGKPVLAATAWMPGIFGSHLVYGNSNLHTVISVHKNSLNLFSHDGIRVVVTDQGKRSVLGMPSAFVMELGRVRWFYRSENLDITVNLSACVDSPILALEVSSSRKVDIEVQADVSGEWKPQVSENSVKLTPVTHAVVQACPGLVYSFDSSSALSYQEGQAPGDATTVIAQAPAATALTLTMRASEEGEAGLPQVCKCDRHGKVQGAVQGEFPEVAEKKASDCQAGYQGKWEHDYESAVHAFTRHFHVTSSSELEQFNRIVPWFTHNALVHVLSPHGLEQYSGAAWGTRDVCQGPLELALAFDHPQFMKTILCSVFEHQAQDGSLPQWFMYDQYSSLYQHDSHGDVPVWPLLATQEYLRLSADKDFLTEKLAFRDSNKPVSILEHLLASVKYTQNHLVPGTQFYSYGEGDWDDTLQPARAEMKKTMASTWTIALLYQAAQSLADVMNNLVAHNQQPQLYRTVVHELTVLARTISDQFADNFIFDDVLAGYVSFDKGERTAIIHPHDTTTGMKYRLIPMTRGIISGLLSKKLAKKHENIIENTLHYADGVRLMNRPAQFNDGIPHIFKRAEQASNVGREIGLMYTHAHIRYAEALAALGRTDVAHELLRISPVDQFAQLPTSARRQRNCYFASSDADFPTRYAAQEGWERLRDDADNPVTVRGGWRVYSSGPGIYIRQLIEHVFGIQINGDYLTIDPLLPEQADGTVLNIEIAGVMRHITYHVRRQDCSNDEGNNHSSASINASTCASERRVTVSTPEGEIPGTTVELPYRNGGIHIALKELTAQAIEVTVSSPRSQA